MNKLLIAVLLAVFSTSVMAEWTRIGSDDISTIYANISTIRKSGDGVKMWALHDFKVVQIFKGDGTRILSMTMQEEYDCKEDTSKLLTFNQYSKNMGAGEVVYASGAAHGEPVPVAPDSVADVKFKVACVK
jgi:hypothetical protein